MISTSSLAAPVLPTPSAAPAPLDLRGGPAEWCAGIPAAGLVRALQLALAAFFLFGGTSLLTDVPAFGPDFELLADLTGAGGALRAAAGGVEALGGLLLLLPAARANAVGTLVLGALMVATAAAYVVVLHAAPVLPVVLLGLAGAVAYARRDALAEVGDFLVRNL